MPWHFLMLAHNFVAAALSLYTRKLSKRFPGAHFQVLSVVIGIMYLFGLSFVFAYGGVQPQAAVANALLFGVVGLLLVASYALTHRVFEHVDTAVGTLYSTLNIVGVIIASSLLIREHLTWHQLLGAVLLLGAMALMLSAHTTHKRHEQWLRALLLSAAAALCFGLGITGEKYLLNRTNLPTYIMFGWGSQLCWALVFGLLLNRDKYKLLKRPEFLHGSMVAGGLRAGAGFLFILALIKANNTSLVAVWSGLRVFLAAAMAAVILRERQFLTRKIEASLVAVAAVALLLW